MRARNLTEKQTSHTDIRYGTLACDSIAYLNRRKADSASLSSSAAAEAAEVRASSAAEAEPPAASEPEPVSAQGLHAVSERAQVSPP